MATGVTASTPSPPPEIIRTPPAPRLGYHDQWEPYSPRKSARISSQNLTSRTPSPSSISTHRQSASPRTSKKVIDRSAPSMVSPVTSPRKRKQPPVDSSRRVSGNLTAESTANAAAALGLHNQATQPPGNRATGRSSSMLPTPSKTPQKPPNEKTAASIQGFARNLFPSEDATPRKRRGKKYSGMTLDSFKAEEEEQPIEIFTDSQERIPVKDASSANPFNSNNSKPQEETGRPRKLRQVYIPGEGAHSVADAAHREDGMVYVFRGKKFFRKFSQAEAEQSDEQEEPEAASNLTRPLTRSSIKPRLLFPQEKSKEMLDEEEATTDVEDNLRPQAPETPRKQQQVPSKTPEAPRYAPVSPPDTKRTTRSTNKLLDIETPVKKLDRKSPFDSWPRTKKEHKGQSTAKRAGETLGQAPIKRARA